MSMMDQFREGGWGMFPTMVFGVLMLGIAVKYAVTPDRRFMPLLTGLGVLTMASGGLGFVTGLITTCHAIGGGRFGDGQDGRITLVGFGESLSNIAFALVFVVLAAIAASWGAYRLAGMTREESRSAA